MDISWIFELLEDASNKNDAEPDPAPDWVKARKKEINTQPERMFSKRLYRPP